MAEVLNVEKNIGGMKAWQQPLHLPEKCQKCETSSLAAFFSGSMEGTSEAEIDHRSLDTLLHFEK